jgi:hypothetical protein
MNVAQRHRLSEHLSRWRETDISLALTRLWLDLDLEGQHAAPEHAADALLADGKPYAPKRRRRHRRKYRARVRGVGVLDGAQAVV